MEKRPTETFNLLQEVYLRCYHVKNSFLSGTRGSEREERMWKMILRVEGQQQAELNENVEHVREKVRSDRRLTVRMIADELSMNSERVWRIIIEDLGMRKVCAKMVPRLLNDGQKENRVQVCQDILKQLEITPDLLSRVVTLVMSHGSSMGRSTHQTAEP